MEKKFFKDKDNKSSSKTKFKLKLPFGIEFAIDKESANLNANKNIDVIKEAKRFSKGNVSVLIALSLLTSLSFSVIYMVSGGSSLTFSRPKITSGIVDDFENIDEIDQNIINNQMINYNYITSDNAINLVKVHYELDDDKIVRFNFDITLKSDDIDLNVINNYLEQNNYQQLEYEFKKEVSLNYYTYFANIDKYPQMYVNSKGVDSTQIDLELIFGIVADGILDNPHIKPEIIPNGTYWDDNTNLLQLLPNWHYRSLSLIIPEGSKGLIHTPSQISSYLLKTINDNWLNVDGINYITEQINITHNSLMANLDYNSRLVNDQGYWLDLQYSNFINDNIIGKTLQEIASLDNDSEIFNNIKLALFRGVNYV